MDLELVGGPYCGIIFCFHEMAVATVLDSLDTEYLGWTGPRMPDEMEMDEDILFLNGPLGDATYRMESERRWQYVPMSGAIA